MLNNIFRRRGLNYNSLMEEDRATMTPLKTHSGSFLPISHHDQEERSDLSKGERAAEGDDDGGIDDYGLFLEDEGFDGTSCFSPVSLPSPSSNNEQRIRHGGPDDSAADAQAGNDFSAATDNPVEKKSQQETNAVIVATTGTLSPLPTDTTPLSPSHLTRPSKTAMKRTSSYGAMELMGSNIPLKFNRRSNKVLPLPPQMSKKKGFGSKMTESTASFFHADESNKSGVESQASEHEAGSFPDFPTMKKNVSFSSIQIREHDTTIGDNPSCMYGTPISLDWNFKEQEPVNLDEYEGYRLMGRRRRSMREMHLSYIRRKHMFAQMGHTEEEIAAAKRATSRTRWERNMTRQMLPLMKLEDVVESMGRKAKRLVGGKKSANHGRRHHRSASIDLGGGYTSYGLSGSISMASLFSEGTNASVHSRASADF